MSLKKINKDCARLHRERSQPAARRHLGYLEKKKDYKQRANDFQTKQVQLKKLRQKAFDKNPDEFHFHMIRSHIVDGKHLEERDDDDEFTPEQLRLMLSQDIGYISYKRQVELRKIEKLRGSLHLIDVANKPRNEHRIFVDKPQQVSAFDLAAHLNVPRELLKAAGNDLPTLDYLAQQDLRSLPKEALKEKTARYRELVKRLNREEQLRLILAKMETKKRVLKDKKDAVRVKKGTKNSAPVYKFKQVRKK